MVEVSDWDNRILARKVRLAALLSLGRDDEAFSLPALSSQTFGTLSSNEEFAHTDSFVIVEVKDPSRREMVEMTGTFHWQDEKLGIAYIVPDGGGPRLPAKLAIDYPATTGRFKNEQAVRFDVSADAVIFAVNDAQDSRPVGT